MDSELTAQFKCPPQQQEVMIARLPIYNIHMDVIGYELLLQPPDGTNKKADPTAATAQVIASTILAFGFGQSVNNRKAFINVTRAFIDIITEIKLPPHQVVLCLPENAAVDSQLIAKLKVLRSLRYGLSIGGLANLKERRLLPIASIFRVDVKKLDPKKLDQLIKFLRGYKNLNLQALKIDTPEECSTYSDMGFDYLQGHFLGKPSANVSRSLTTNKLAILQLLATVHNPDTSIQDLEQLISCDASLSYKLIKLVNASFFGVPHEVDSIKQAIVLLGRDEIRKWVSLLALSGMSTAPGTIMEIAILRAKTCELLAQKVGLQQEIYFTVGMFSALDILMKQPIETILASLPLNDEIKAAILERQGTLGDALTCALAIENAQWSGINFENLSHADISDLSRQAIQWTEDTLSRF